MYEIEYLVEHALRDEAYDESLIVELLTQTPLHVLLAAAEKVKRILVGDVASYVINLYIAYTNVCIARCPICNFYARSKSEEYTLSTKSVAEMVAKFYKSKQIREVHIAGGLNPDLTLDYYVKVLKSIREVAKSVKIKAFTAEEISFIARVTGESVRSILSTFRDAGLDALPGGGAEILDEQIRKIISPYKSNPQSYIEVHATAHSLGIPSNATMLYGHIEEPRHVARHLLEIYKVQGKTQGFISFIPLRWNPGSTALAANPQYRNIISKKLDGTYDLRIIAVSRLALAPRVKHIVAYWVAVGKKLASLALRAGADDIGGTFYNEPVIAAAQGRRRHSGLEPSELEYLILHAGLRPVERDTFYNYFGAKVSLEAWRKMPWLLERFS